MSSGLDSLVGVLPVVVVGGLAMKMTERMFPERRRKSSKRTSSHRLTRRKVNHPGNFSNIGM